MGLITNISINWWATGFDTWAISSRSTDKYLMFHEIFKLFLSEDNRVSHGLNYTGQPILAYMIRLFLIFITFAAESTVHIAPYQIGLYTNYYARKYQ